MSATKKSSTTKPAAAKKASTRAPATHPSWQDMIKVRLVKNDGYLFPSAFPLVIIVSHSLLAGPLDEPKRGRAQGAADAARHLSSSSALLHPLLPLGSWHFCAQACICRYRSKAESLFIGIGVYRCSPRGSSLGRIPPINQEVCATSSLHPPP